MASVIIMPKQGLLMEEGTITGDGLSLIHI
mgnify:CR=1 FL=1